MKAISNLSNNILTNLSRQEKKHSSTNNSYQNKKCDQKNFIKPPVEILFPIPDNEVLDDPLKALSQLPESDKKILGLLLSLKKRFKVVAPTQEYIAKKIGYSRQTTNASLGRLHAKKLIYKGYRHMRPCFYNLSPFLLHESTAMKLRSLFSTYKRMFIFSLSLLIISSSSISKGFTRDKFLRNNKDYYYFKNVGFNQGRVMESAHTVLLDITKKLRLTKWGQIRLSAFPEQALQHALDDYEFAQKYQKKSIDNVFSWFFKSCLVYCNEHNITPDWVLMKKLETQHGMPTNPLFIQASNIKISTKGPEVKKSTMPTSSFSTSSNSLNKSQEPSASKLYPVWKPEQRKIETAQERKQNILAWLPTQNAENFAKLMGKEGFEKFVANLLVGDSE